MAWVYEQASGRLEKDCVLVSYGYSGHDEGRNNPDMEEVVGVGPIPRGKYNISAPMDTQSHGPYVLGLLPQDPAAMFGRSGFLIHGDSKEHPGEASKGCIILPRQIREQIWESGDHELEVVA